MHKQHNYIIIVVIEMKNEDIRIKVGKRIKELRNNLKISQEDFAILADLNRTYITSLERGQRNISLINLDKISSVFNMTLKQFFDFDN